MYKRVILKISGEALQDDESRLILSAKKLDEVATTIKEIKELNVDVGIVIGAGNIFRGRIAEEAGINPIDGDYMGMVGTVINCKALASVLEKINIKSKIFSALEVEDVTLKFDESEVNKALDEGYVCLFSAGLGKPRITTDSCAAKRSIQIQADAILAGKNGVDGVYDSDPRTNKDAKLLKKLTYTEALDRDLKVMDRGAMEMLKNTKIVTRVFSMEDKANFLRVLKDDKIGTIIKE